MMKSNIIKFVKRSLLALPLVVAPAISSVVVQELGFDASFGVVAAGECKSRKLPGVSQSMAKQLTKVQEFIQPPEGSTAKPNLNAAIAELGKIGKKKDKFNQYELSQLYTFYAYAYYMQENVPQALKNYKLVVAQSPMIPCGIEAQNLYTIAQLEFMQEDYKESIKYLQKWLKISTLVTANNNAFFASVYYQSGDQNSALKYINKAVNDYEAKGKKPKEDWFAVQRALYYEKEDYSQVINILEKLVVFYPKTTYYKQLSSMYAVTSRDREHLGMLDATYVLGALTKEKELLNLAYLYLDKDAPYLSAKILTKGMKAKVIPETMENLELLANAWIMASEPKKAALALVKAAPKSNKGNLYALLARTYVMTEEFSKAASAGNKAIKKGGIKRADQLQITIGQAYMELNQYSKASAAFKAAAKDKRSKKSAENWIRFSASQKRRWELYNKG
jgi:hypothetical protein|tara:strand:- start:4542 stop:5885 length:1344 start_codon:yes stop_codon:yes gene_type:complete